MHVVPRLIMHDSRVMIFLYLVERKANVRC